MSLLSIMVRAMFKKGDDKRDAGLVTPDDIARFDDLIYGPDPDWNVLDVYRPKGTNALLPVIVSIHGGGWVYGDKERYQYYCMSLAQHGFAVVNFTYRLAPKYKYPASMEDTHRVFSWIRANADRYHLDTTNVFAVGDSAGAHMLGLFCCLCTDAELAKTMPFTFDKTLMPKGVALNCGVYKIEKSAKKDLTTMLMADLLKGKGTEEELKQISVMDHVNASFPPAFVMTAEGDFLASQAQPLVDLLKSSGCQAEYHYYGDKEHPLGHVFHCNMRLEQAALCNKDECDFFKKLVS